METTVNVLQSAGLAAGYVTVALLCLAGVGLSCLSISGTWLVLAATVLAAWLTGPEFPGLWTIAGFFLLCVLVEVAEGVAGAWGVKRRGGSSAAGVMAVIGGLLGLAAGTLIPIPVVGGLLGMLAGSFTLAYLTERRRLTAGKSAHIAWGAVTARVLVILMKVVVTLAMVVFLGSGLVQ